MAGDVGARQLRDARPKAVEVADVGAGGASGGGLTAALESLPRSALIARLRQSEDQVGGSTGGGRVA